MRFITFTSSNDQVLIDAIRRPTQDLSAYREKVIPIMTRVRRDGDTALYALTEQFDGVRLASIKVPKADILNSTSLIPKDLLSALEQAKTNIEKFHLNSPETGTRTETVKGASCWTESRPIDSVGLYVPGGSAALASTVLMLAIPARIAGVPRIALCSPPQKTGGISDAVLAACAVSGVDEVYAIGGAQAIAAMAYGTETVPKVCKIAGPGNVYVSAAKAEVSIDPDGAAIDMLAGPSELMVIADDAADVSFVAADVLSQAEHDSLAQVVVVTTSRRVFDSLNIAVERQISSLPRADIAQRALESSTAVFVPSLDVAIELANLYAPEHLSIQTRFPERVIPSIRNAGSVFLGAYAPETVGDYCSGTNHVLPTSGMAKVQGGLSVNSFRKRFTVQELSEEGLRSLKDIAATLARAEGLEAHATAAEIRFPS